MPSDMSVTAHFLRIEGDEYIISLDPPAPRPPPPASDDCCNFEI